MKNITMIFVLAISQVFCSGNDNYYQANSRRNVSACAVPLEQGDIESKFFVVIRNTLLDEYPDQFRYVDYSECRTFGDYIFFDRREGGVRFSLNQRLDDAALSIRNVPALHINKRHNYESMRKVRTMLMHLFRGHLTGVNFDTYDNFVQITGVNPQNIPAILMGNAGFLFSIPREHGDGQEDLSVSPLSRLMAYCQVMEKYYPYETDGISGVLPTAPLSFSLNTPVVRHSFSVGLAGGGAIGAASGGAGSEIVINESLFFQRMAQQFPSYPYLSRDFVAYREGRRFNGVNFRINDCTSRDPRLTIFLGQIPFVFTSTGEQFDHHLENMKKVLSVISAIFVEVDFVRFATRMRSSCHIVFKTIEAAQGATACNRTVLFGKSGYIKVDMSEQEVFNRAIREIHLSAEPFSPVPMIVEMSK